MSAPSIRLPGGRFEFEDTILGEGLQGQVHLGRDTLNNDAIAIKFINKSEFDAKNLERFHREIKILEGISNPSIVSLKAYMSDYVLPTNAGGNGKPWGAIVMELCPFDMFDYLLVEGRFSEVLARTYFSQLLSGLQACHSVGVFHRDIKPENLLLDNHFQLKIADFGLAAVVQTAPASTGGSSSLLTSYCGSNAYMAPEVFASQTYEGVHADLWSAACVLFVMITGLQPFAFPGPTDWWMDKVNRGRYAKFWEAHCQSAPHMRQMPAAQDIINRMFVASPAGRLSIRGIREHPWMAQGPSHSPSELTEVMRAKEATVKGAKELERQRKAAEKAQKAAQLAQQQARGTAGGVYKNAFDRNTHRALEVSVAPQYHAPLTSTGAVAPTSVASRSLWEFFSSLDSTDALLAVERGLRRVDAAARFAVDPTGFVVRVSMLHFPGAVVGEGEDAETLPPVSLQGTIKLFTYTGESDADASNVCTFVQCFHGLLPEEATVANAAAAGAGAETDTGVFAATAAKAISAAPRALGDVFTFTRLVKSLKEYVASAEQLQQAAAEEGAKTAEVDADGDEVPLSDELGMV